MRGVIAQCRKPEAWLALLPLLAAVAAHGPALWSDFVLFDDREMLLEHPQLDAVAQWPGLFLRDYFAHAGHAHGMYRPLALLAYALDRFAWGGAPAGFHLTNLLLHAATALAVTALATRLGLRWRWAVLAGCAFAVNPVHAETVGWIVGRCDLIATLGAVVALTAHLAGRPWLAAGALLFGLLGKESAAAVAPLALLLAWGGHYPAGGDRIAACKRAAIAGGVVVAGYAAMRYAALGADFLPSSFGTGSVPTAALWLPERLLLFGQSAAKMTGGMAFGAGLCADHSAAPAWQFPSDHVFTLGGLTLAVAAALTWFAGVIRARTGSLMALGIAWIGVTWLPVAQISPIRVVQADRFCSMASAGWAVAIAACCFWLADRARRAGAAQFVVVWAAVLGPVLCAGHTVLSWWRAEAFSGPAAHARDVLALYPQDAQAWNRLGIYFDERGEHDKAIRRYERAVDISRNPRAAGGRGAGSAFMNLGTLHLEQGNVLRARPLLEEARRRSGPSPKLDFNLARLHTLRGDYDAARSLYNNVLARWPVKAGRQLAQLHADHAHHPEAIAAFRAALAHAPDDARLHQGLAASLLAAGGGREAVTHARRAVKRFPGWPRGQLTLARALLAQGDRAGAGAALAIAAAGDPELPEVAEAAELLETLKNPR
jgi:Flp pilus assembly protein TadD